MGSHPIFALLHFYNRCPCGIVRIRERKQRLIRSNGAIMPFSMSEYGQFEPSSKGAHIFEGYVN